MCVVVVGSGSDVALCCFGSSSMSNTYVMHERVDALDVEDEEEVKDGDCDHLPGTHQPGKERDAVVRLAQALSCALHFAFVYT